MQYARTPPYAQPFAAVDGAVAALGDDIRQYPDVAPTLLIGREWTGVAVMRLPDRPGYHRVRTPHVTETDAAQLMAHCAQLRQPPHTTLHALADLDTGEVAG